MSWTLCTSGAAIRKAGSNANSTIIASGAALADWSDEAENLACDFARYDVISNFGSLTTNGKQILQNFATAHIAQKIITYSLSSYDSTSEYTMLLNIQENDIRRAQKILEDEKKRTFLGIST